MIFDKRYFFSSSVKNKMLSQMLLLFSFFASYVSPELVAFFHVICFIKTGCFNCCLFFCLFLPFKYFVFCGKKWFSTKDISSLLLWGTKCCLRCYFFFFLDQLMCFIFRLLFFTSYVSPKVVAFFTSYVSTKLVASTFWCLVDSVVASVHQSSLVKWWLQSVLMNETWKMT